MRLWIDQDLCTGDGKCEEICPSRFVLVDGIAHVRDGAGRTVSAHGAVSSTELDSDFPDSVVEATEECPGECIFIEM